MDNIYEKQNHRKYLLLRKAHKDAYSLAKKLYYAGFISSMVFAIAFAILIQICRTPIIAALSSFFAIIVFAINNILQKLAEAQQEKGAKIQQYIDIELFGLPEGHGGFVNSEIAEVIASYSDDLNLTEFMNWYDDYSDSEHFRQVLYSQYQNIRWDTRLRIKYLCWIRILAFLLPIIFIIYCLLTNINIIQCFSVIAWLFPIEKVIIEQWVKIQKSIYVLNKLNEEHKYIECNGVFNNCDLCNLQTSIFSHRKNSFIIPDWFYKLFCKEMQEHSERIARYLQQ